MTFFLGRYPGKVGLSQGDAEFALSAGAVAGWPLSDLLFCPVSHSQPRSPRQPFAALTAKPPTIRQPSVQRVSPSCLLAQLAAVPSGAVGERAGLRRSGVTALDMSTALRALALVSRAINSLAVCVEGVEELVEAGLIHRSEHPTGRRHLILQITESGWQLIHTMNQHRRAAIASILTKMCTAQRSSLVQELPPCPVGSSALFRFRTQAQLAGQARGEVLAEHL